MPCHSALATGQDSFVFRVPRPSKLRFRNQKRLKLANVEPFLCQATVLIFDMLGDCAAGNRHCQKLGSGVMHM